MLLWMAHWKRLVRQTRLCSPQSNNATGRLRQVSGLSSSEVNSVSDRLLIMVAHAESILRGFPRP
jgi:hypothetical protein